MKSSCAVLGFLILFASQLATAAATVPAAGTPPMDATQRKWSFVEAGLIPVQSGGRIKPLDSVARETILYITGSRTFQGWNPVDLYFSWIAYPEFWSKQPVIRISNKQLLRQLLLDESQSRFAASDLMHNNVFAQYAQDAMREGPGAKPSQVVQSVSSQPPARETELKNVLERIQLFRSVGMGTALTIVPEVGSENWKSLADGDPTQHPTRKAFLDLLRAYFHGDQTAFISSAGLVRARVQADASHWSPSVSRSLEVESLYNRVRPFAWAYWFYFLGGFLFSFAQVVSAAKSKKLHGKLEQIGWVTVVIAFGLHILGFAARCYIAGRPPVSNMYESVVWVSFGCMMFAQVIYFLYRNSVVLASGCFFSALALLAADMAPAVMDPGIHTLVPVLRSNLWLTIHVMTITLGYAAFALSLSIANVTLFQYLRGALGKLDVGSVNTRTHHLNQLTYRAMQFGVVLLAAGTILGGVWADYSWGRFWGWDPKETWALIALLCYLAVLHGRYAGWVTQFGYAVWTVICFLSVLMAWYGVNFVLGVGLHSYGFSSGGTATMLIFSALQLGYVGLIVALRSGKSPTAKAAGSA